MSLPSQERDLERLSRHSVGYFAFLTVQSGFLNKSGLFLCSNKILIHLNLSMYSARLHSIYYITNFSLKLYFLWLMEEVLVVVARFVVALVFLVVLCLAVGVPVAVVGLALVAWVHILFLEAE